MRILVTGGAGYVGTRLSNHLARKGHKVVVFDSLLYGSTGLHEDIRVVKGDICHRKELDAEMHGMEAVFHLAAISNDPTGNLDPALTQKVNYQGTLNVLASAKHACVPRFIFASSSSVLGIQDGTNVTETATPAPLTPYSSTKHQAEMAVIAENSTNFITCALRPATICGPSPRQRFDLVVNALAGSAIASREIVVYGGRQRRPNLTMSDMIRVYDLVLNAKAKDIGGEVFHVGWDNSTILDLARKVAETVKDLTGDPMIPITIKPSEDSRDYHISSGKILNRLGFSPKYSISDMVRELYVVLNAGFLSDPSSPQYHNLKMLGK